MSHHESHRSERIGWLRAAVLGANDGIVSNASLIVGIASSGATRDQVLVSGLAALVAGAMSMAAGEYVSVSSQSDTENADLEKERLELKTNPEYELEEMTRIYMERGLDRELASVVAKKLTDYDALGTHARDELGIVPHLSAKPLQAAVVSALTFSVGAVLPLLIFILDSSSRPLAVSLISLLCLGGLGAIASRAGGARVGRGAFRVIFWGAFAMAVTAGVGYIFKVNVS